MNIIKLPLIAAAVAVCASSAMAMPFGEPGVDLSLKQDARLVCHANGRCYETRRAWRDYDEPYYARRSYGYYAPDYDYYGGPGWGGPSVGFSFGFGGGHHRW
jgi:hypothetical protein